MSGDVIAMVISQDLPGVASATAKCCKNKNPEPSTPYAPQSLKPEPLSLEPCSKPQSLDPAGHEQHPAPDDRQEHSPALSRRVATLLGSLRKWGGLRGSGVRGLVAWGFETRN